MAPIRTPRRKRGSAPPTWRKRRDTRWPRDSRRSRRPSAPRLTNRRASEAHPRAELAGLPPRDLHFGSVTELKVEPASEAELHFLDEVEVHDLPPVRAEEALRIQLFLERDERAAQQRLVLAPLKAHVISLSGEDTDFAEGNEPAARAIPNEQLFQRSIRARRGLR